MPVERSGQPEFDFEFGEDFGEHIEAFDPSFSKVLVRWNPEADPDLNACQVERLSRSTTGCTSEVRLFLFELLVPAEPHQLEAVDGDAGPLRWELRPGSDAARDRPAPGRRIEPDIWKIEGLDRRDDCVRRRAAPRRRTRRRGVRGARARRRQRRGRSLASDCPGVPGYVGFAIGRSIWWDPLRAFVDGASSREDAAARISSNYRRFIDVYEGG